MFCKSRLERSSRSHFPGHRAALAPLLAALLALAACSSGGGGDSAATSAGTGSVGVLFTDGPTDDFCAIPVTITGVELISDEGHVSLFEGSRQVDLLELRDNTRLITLGADVPVRSYSKIRLEVGSISVEICDESGAVIESVPVRHSSGKIDLNPRRSFSVGPGELVLIQLDMDAEKAIHVVETGGRHEYRFRPVIFVDVFAGSLPDRLVLLSGEIAALDADARRFDLCGTHAVSRPDAFDRDDGRMTLSMDAMRGDSVDDNGDWDGDRDACVGIDVVDDTSIFDTEVMPAGFGDLVDGGDASVLGRFVRDGDRLRVMAEVIQLGPPGTVDVLRGDVLTEVVDDAFDLALDPDQGPSASELSVLLQEGTKIFSSTGERLGDDSDPSAIQPGLRARVAGQLDQSGADPRFDSTVIFLREPSEINARLAGDLIDRVGSELTIRTRSGAAECATVPAGADVFLASLDADSLEFERTDLSALEALIPIPVDVFGVDVGGSCIEARTVIGFDLGS